MDILCFQPNEELIKAIYGNTFGVAGIFVALFALIKFIKTTNDNKESEKQLLIEKQRQDTRNFKEKHYWNLLNLLSSENINTKFIAISAAPSFMANFNPPKHEFDNEKEYLKWFDDAYPFVREVINAIYYQVIYEKNDTSRNKLANVFAKNLSYLNWYTTATENKISLKNSNRKYSFVNFNKEKFYISPITFKNNDFFNLTFEKINLNGSDFSDCKFEDIYFKRVSFEDVYFSGSNWNRENTIEESFLIGTTFYRSEIERLEIKNSIIYKVDFSNSTIHDLVLEDCFIDIDTLYRYLVINTTNEIMNSNEIKYSDEQKVSDNLGNYLNKFLIENERININSEYFKKNFPARIVKIIDKNEHYLNKELYKISCNFEEIKLKIKSTIV